MNNVPVVKNSNKMLKLLFLFITITAAFWILVNTVNVYNYTVAGVFFELFWLPMVLLTIAIPVLSFIGWYKKGFSITSPFLYLAGITAFLNVLMIVS